LNHNALRLSLSTHTKIIRDGKEMEVAIAELRQLLAVDGLIRLQEAEFQVLRGGQLTYTHFNLERTTNAVGKRYAVVPIVMPGRRLHDDTELLPVIDVERARVGICLEVQQRVPITVVAPRYFDHSLSHIKTRDQLQDVLLARYRGMFPGLTAEDILSRGCAISLIDLR